MRLEGKAAQVSAEVSNQRIQLHHLQGSVQGGSLYLCIVQCNVGLYVDSDGRQATNPQPPPVDPQENILLSMTASVLYQVPAALDQ